jgi:hypothetical protein
MANATPALEAPATTTTSVKERVVEAERLTKLVPDKVHTWPYLVRLEMLVGTVVMAFMTIWSIVVDAPLEEPANPTKTPNPSKAPWYFLGLQEVLVYFDPWFAGVVLPAIIIVGLMVIPYIDINPKGNGYYCFRDRKFAVLTFLWGFLVMWIVLIIMGTFIRGPGWYLFLPGQYWDVHKTVAITNVDLSDLVGIRDRTAAMIFGGVVLLAYMIGIPAIYWKARYKKSAVLQQLGSVRYWITAFFFMTMVGTCLKVVLRLTLDIKNVFASPWINV